MQKNRAVRVCDVCNSTFNPRGLQKRCSAQCQKIGEKQAASKYNRKYMEDSERRQKTAEYQRKWRELNREHLTAYRKQREEITREERNIYRAEYRKKNKDQIKQNHFRWRQKNKEKLSIISKQYRSSEQGKQKAFEYTKRREQTDPVFLIVRRIRARIKISLLKSGTAKAKKTVEYLGMTGEQFMTYLLQHPSNAGNFTRENFGKAWVVDHIRPIASFDLNDEQQMKEAFHYTNCQPLSPKENASKGCFWNGLYWRNGKGRKLPYCSLQAG